MNSVIINVINPGDVSPIDTWLQANEGVTIKFVLCIAPYEILILYTDP